MPLLFNCIVAIWCAKSQYVALASQRYTWPAETGFEPALTAAVPVTETPWLTVETAAPPALRARVVEVAVALLLRIFSNSDVEAVSVPEFPVMVTVELPIVAVLLTVRVSVLLVVAVAGEKVAVTPAGRPLTERFTPLAKPLIGMMLIVDLPEAPGTANTSFGAAESEKLPAFTTTCACTELVILPEVPVMVKVAVPRAAVLVAESAIVLKPVVGFGENVAVTPLGSPEALRVTLPAKPYCEFTVTGEVALLPWFRLTL